MKNPFKYLGSLISGSTIQKIDALEADKLVTICTKNIQYLRAHINTSNALMNSYPARSIKRKNMSMFINKLTLRLEEQEQNKKNYLQITKQALV